LPTELSVIDLDIFITGSHNSEAVIQGCKKCASSSRSNDHNISKDNLNKQAFLEVAELEALSERFGIQPHCYGALVLHLL
jgi:hypothetical protein